MSTNSTSKHPGQRPVTRILLVDDNPAFLKIYAQLLRETGYEVRAARNGRQALRMIRKGHPDLVILDVVLPDLSGIEVCQEIKQDKNLKDIFIILISGHGIGSDQAIQGLAAGADEYLSKPLALGEFLARIRTMTRLVETAKALRASEQHYRRLIEILPDAVALIDAQRRLTGLNQRAVAMLGFPKAEDILGKSIFELVQPADHNRFRADIGLLKTGAVQTVQYEFLGRDGQNIPVEINAAFSTGTNGDGVELIAVIRDITDHRRLENELRDLPRRITEAQEAERLRVARELHDGVNQVIAAAAIRLARVQRSLSSQNPAASEIIVRCHGLLVQALEENRRIAHNLRPNDLDELGLSAACRNLCQELQNRAGTEVKWNFTSLDRSFPPDVDLALFRMVQEGLNNVEKHAHATLVRLRIAVLRDTILLRIQDNGRGFDLAAIDSVKGKRRGIGLTSLRERASALGGKCELVSSPKQGSLITVRIPFPHAARIK